MWLLMYFHYFIYKQEIIQSITFHNVASYVNF